MPKSVVKLEDLYDLKDRFKRYTNSKLQNSTLNYELVNLGIDTKPQNIYLGLGLAPEERLAYVCLLKNTKVSLPVTIMNLRLTTLLSFSILSQ